MHTSARYLHDNKLAVSPCVMEFVQMCRFFAKILWIYPEVNYSKDSRDSRISRILLWADLYFLVILGFIYNSRDFGFSIINAYTL